MIAHQNSLEVRRTLTQEDFDAFAKLSGDDNPIHVDPDFSAQTRFGRTVAHGLLLVTILHGMTSRLVPGYRLVNHSFMFPAPTFADETMIFQVTSQTADDSAMSVSFRISRERDDTVTCEGTGLLRAAGDHP